MGRVKISLGIVIGIILISIIGLVALDHETDEIIALLDRTKEYSDQGDTRKALEAAEEFEEEWEKYHSLASVFVRNDKITNIQTSVSRLRPLIEKENDELNAEIANARSGLEWIVESEIPRLTNIL
ncbi:MAG: DUF4363 family protein [Porcipelethomonas sp.]